MAQLGLFGEPSEETAGAGGDQTGPDEGAPKRPRKARQAAASAPPAPSQTASALPEPPAAPAAPASAPPAPAAVRLRPPSLRPCRPLRRWRRPRPPPRDVEKGPFSTAALAKELNEPQLDAVVAPGGPLVVVAGAGSGKTRVITYRIARLVAAGADPRRILSVTFTNKAAGEMRERVSHLLWERLKVSAGGLWLGTFHALSARLLRKWGEAIGVKKDFVIYDDDDQKRLLARVLIDLAVPERLFPVRQVLSAIDRAQNQGITAADFRADSYVDDVVQKAFKLYEQRLRAANATDFGGLLLQALRLLEEPTAARDEVRSAFDHVLGRRVPGHQQRPVPAGAPPQPRHRQHHRRRRRGSVDLQVARRGHPQHPRLRARPRGNPGREAGTELPLHRQHPPRRQRHHLAQHRAAPEDAVHHRGRGRPHHHVRGRDRARRGGVRRRPHRRRPVRVDEPARLRRLLSDQRPVARAGRRVAGAQSPLRGRRRHPVLRSRRDQEPDRLPARGRQRRRCHGVAADHQRAGARHRRQHRRQGGGVCPPARVVVVGGAGADRRRPRVLGSRPPQDGSPPSSS